MFDVTSPVLELDVHVCFVFWIRNSILLSVWCTGVWARGEDPLFISSQLLYKELADQYMFIFDFFQDQPIGLDRKISMKLVHGYLCCNQTLWVGVAVASKCSELATYLDYVPVTGAALVCCKKISSCEHHNICDMRFRSRFLKFCILITHYQYDDHAIKAIQKQ